MFKRIVYAALRPFVHRWARSQVPADLAAGDLCVIPAREAGYAIIKILAVDAGGLHVRLYKERFPTVPDDLDRATLSLGGLQD